MPTDKEFEDFFREQFQGLEEAPPADGWNKIQQEIEPRGSYLTWLTATVLIFAVSFTALFTTLRQQLQQRKADTQIVTGNQAAALQSENQAERIALAKAEPAGTVATEPEEEKEANTNKPAAFSAPAATVLARSESAAPKAKSVSVLRRKVNTTNSNAPVSATEALSASEMKERLAAADKPAAPSPKAETNAELEATPGTITRVSEPEAKADTMGQMVQSVFYNPDKKAPARKGLRKLFGKK